MKKLNLALILTALIVFLLGIVEVAGASWQQAQITLIPGQATTVIFSNSDNVPIALTISTISAPPSLVPYLFVSPTTIPENSFREVTLQFVHIPQSIRENISPDVYAFRVSGDDSDLLVYLDLSVPPPENAENRWAEIEARIEALGESLDEWITALSARIAALESAPKENWMPRIENLRSEILAKIENLRAMIESRPIHTPPENSPPFDIVWLTALLDNKEMELRTSIANDIANLEIDQKLANAKAENERLRLETYVAIAIAIVAIAITIRRPKFTMPSLKPQQKRFEEIPLGDKITMLENEIDAMKERGGPEDSIKEKEQELWKLRDQLKPRKRGK